MLTLLFLVAVFFLSLLVLAPLSWTMRNREPVPFLQQYKENVFLILRGIGKDIYENIEIILTFVIVIVAFIICRSCGVI